MVGKTRLEFDDYSLAVNCVRRVKN